MSKAPRILLFDIETSPNLAYVWGKWEQDVIAYKSEWQLLSFSWKFLGEGNKIRAIAQNLNDERTLVKALWNLFNVADIIIAHNGDEFDVKKAKAKFIEYGLKPPSPYKTIDTKKIASRQFKFNSNSLDDLGRLLKIGRKKQTGGFDLWLKCMAGDRKAWSKMIEYNRQDVALLERVYLKLRAWQPNPPDVLKDTTKCRVCISSNLISRGSDPAKGGIKRKYVCKDCGHWTMGKLEKIKI